MLNTDRNQVIKHMVLLTMLSSLMARRSEQHIKHNVRPRSGRVGRVIPFMSQGSGISKIDLLLLTGESQIANHRPVDCSEGTVSLMV